MHYQHYSLFRAFPWQQLTVALNTATRRQMDLPHPSHRLKHSQNLQMCAQENKPKPAQGAAEGYVTEEYDHREQMYDRQSLVHLFKGKPSQKQCVSTSQKVTNLFQPLKSLLLLLASGTVFHFCKEAKVKIGHLESQEGKKRSVILQNKVTQDYFLVVSISRGVCPQKETNVLIYLLKR